VQGELVVHYVEAGSGQPVRLLHGFLEWSDTWRHNLPALAGSGRIIAPDLRGFGLTERGPRRGDALGDQVKLVKGLMDALGVEQAVRSGHSMGGEVALRFALEHPGRVRALVLVDASGYVRRTPHPVERWLPGVPGAAALFLRGMVLNRRFVRRALEFRYGSPKPGHARRCGGLPAPGPGARLSFLHSLE
jgi:pimeloyl-ACP methyl ester carboxylesterase